MTNAFIRKVKNITGTTLTTIGTNDTNGTCPAAHTWTAVGLTVANTYSTAIKASVALYDNTTTYYLVKDADIPIGGTLVVIGGDQKVVMNNPDRIRVATSNAAYTCDVILSILDSY